MDIFCYNQVKKIASKINIDNKTVLEVGSRDYNGSVRPLFKKSNYIGIDLQKGKGVDVVMPSDFVIPFESNTFDIVLCLSCLEHCRNPFLLTSEMSRCLKLGGIIIIAVPQKWGLHDYPHDYWRINPDGMRELFKVSGITPVDIFTHSQLTIRHGILKMTYGIGKK